MRFTVGGEQYDLTRERVIAAMGSVQSEPVQKHLVQVDGAVFPPKQVFATVTGRARTSFTTMEAQRVLRRLGFVCRQTGQLDLGTPTSVAESGGVRSAVDVGDEVSSAEARLATLEAAVAGLHARVKQLEAARRAE
jgi:hypothetical protein